MDAIKGKKRYIMVKTFKKQTKKSTDLIERLKLENELKFTQCPAALFMLRFVVDLLSICCRLNKLYSCTTNPHEIHNKSK